MGCLKGFITFILSFLFFITLTVFSVDFMLQGTALNADFISNQVDKVPVSSIARDIAEGQIGKELPQDAVFLKEVSYDIIAKQEPWIKTQLKSAINSGYGYFLGDTNTFSITVSLSELKTNLTGTLWPEAKVYLNQQLAGKSVDEISSYLQNIILQIPTNMLPPELSTLTIVERNEYIEQYLRDAAGVASKAGYPTLDAYYKNLGDQYVTQYLNEFVRDIPDAYTIDQSTINSDTMHAFQQIKQDIGYFQTYYYWLILAMIVLVALIFLINWNLKASTRWLGIDLIIFGAIDLVGIILIRTLPWMDWTSSITKTQIPTSLSTWVQGFVNDITAVAIPLTIGILVVGVISLVVSFIIPKRKKEVIL
jgi:hypothetical protein